MVRVQVLCGSAGASSSFLDLTRRRVKCGGDPREGGKGRLEGKAEGVQGDDREEG